METRYNRNVRVNIEKAIDYMSNNYVPTNLSFILLTENIFYKYSLLFKPKSFDVFYTMLCQVVYLDAYKKLLYLKKHFCINEKEELYWKHINEIEDFFDLYTKISDDPDVFAYMIKASYEFQKSNGLIKLLQTKSLTEEENKHLLEIAPVHKEDLDYYNTSITLERLIKNYKAQIKYYANNEEENPEEKASFNIYNFIKQLSLIDRNNFTTLVKELIKNDYIVSKTHGIENDYLNLYDDLNVGDLIQKMLDDQRVLKNILSHLNEYYNDTIDEIEEDYILKKMN